MIIESNLKTLLKEELKSSKSIWTATAMISNRGWSFLQKYIPEDTTQYFLIGIDLATDPGVFESILEHTAINARVYKTAYIFHPKVYLIQKEDEKFTAFIGSSNTTSGGFDNNLEMNFQINDQQECLKLLRWFRNLFSDGYMITKDFVEDYKSSFVKASSKAKEIKAEAHTFKSNLTTGEGQYFSRNHHEIFRKEYHYIENENFKAIRRDVRHKFLELHREIYPKFEAYGLIDLYRHYHLQNLTSSYFFGRYSGYYINAIWLHYGKSKSQLETYKNSDRSINKPGSFINHIRMQVIIHEKSIGIWLVLGKDYGSVIDRKHFRASMMDPAIQKKFFKAFKELGNDYWINVPNAPETKNIKSPADLWKETQKERIEEYFIIGCDIDWLDKRLSEKNLPNTILGEFKRLYPLYEIMRHR